MRIHLGHHFYGAGNLGDDFMLAGFLTELKQLAPHATLTSSVPFALEPLRRRFPQIEWLPWEQPARERSIAACEVWLGLGGSPFQSAQSRWFIDHLTEEAAVCDRLGKPMFYLGVGMQARHEVAAPEMSRLIAQAEGIWTRDAASAERLAEVGRRGRVALAADLAHLLFRKAPPPRPAAGSVALVANFDYGAWPGQLECLAAIEKLPVRERIWLAQESRELPGAELALHAALPVEDKARWQLRSPEIAGAPIDRILARWPSAEWLITARFHAALAGAWAGSKIVVIATNEKLKGVAKDLGCPLLDPAAPAAEVAEALAQARPSAPPRDAAERAERACREFVALATKYRTSRPARGADDGQ